MEKTEKLKNRIMKCGSAKLVSLIEEYDKLVERINNFKEISSLEEANERDILLDALYQIEDEIEKEQDRCKEELKKQGKVVIDIPEDAMSFDELIEIYNKEIKKGTAINEIIVGKSEFEFGFLMGYHTRRIRSYYKDLETLDEAIIVIENKREIESRIAYG